MPRNATIIVAAILGVLLLCTVDAVSDDTLTIKKIRLETKSTSLNEILCNKKRSKKVKIVLPLMKTTNELSLKEEQPPFDLLHCWRLLIQLLYPFLIYSMLFIYTKSTLNQLPKHGFLTISFTFSQQIILQK